MKRAIVFWGIAGVAALLAESVVRLGLIAARAVPHIETWPQVATLVVWSAVIVYAEGHRAFHRRFCPLTVARARALPRIVVEPGRWWLLPLAPLFAMGLLHATRRRLGISWGVVGGVVLLVVGIRHFADPWRGIVDAGVAMALGYGTVSLVWHSLSPRSVAARTDPELPGAEVRIAAAVPRVGPQPAPRGLA